MSEEALLNDIRVLLVDGTLSSGADADLYCMRKIWRALPFYLVCPAPVSNTTFRYCYRSFADNRHRISRLRWDANRSVLAAASESRRDTATGCDGGRQRHGTALGGDPEP